MVSCTIGRVGSRRRVALGFAVALLAAAPAIGATPWHPIASRSGSGGFKLKTSSLPIGSYQLLLQVSSTLPHQRFSASYEPRCIGIVTGRDIFWGFTPASVHLGPHAGRCPVTVAVTSSARLTVVLLRR